MARWEPVLLALFFTSWLGAFLQQLGVLSLAGTFPLGLYPLFGLAAAIGWSFGNVYLVRCRNLPRRLRRRILPVYLVGPPGILYLLWSAEPEELQVTAPFMPLLALGVFAIFFLVPLTLSGHRIERKGGGEG